MTQRIPGTKAELADILLTMIAEISANDIPSEGTMNRARVALGRKTRKTAIDAAGEGIAMSVPGLILDQREFKK